MTPERSLPRVWIDPATCIGSGNCVQLACGAFVLNADGIAEAVEPGAVADDQLRLAARSCPTGAICIELA